MMHRCMSLIPARLSPTGPLLRSVPRHCVSNTCRQSVRRYSQLGGLAAAEPRRDDGGGLIDGNVILGGAIADSRRGKPARTLPQHDVGAVVRARDLGKVLSVKFENAEQEARLSKVWLRDCCRCSTCVDPSSGQKNFETCDIPPSLTIRDVAVRDGSSLEVLWADDFLSPGQEAHKSVYPASLISKSVVAPGESGASGSTVAHVPWDRKLFEGRARPISYSDWIAGGDEFWRAFVDLAQLGLIFIRGVPDSETAVEAVAETIGHIQTTFYGRTWDVVSKPRAENVAYTNVFLGLHQDLLYIKDPPRLQLLHCLANSCEGGESLFSDGVRAAEEVRRRDPCQFDLLRSTPVYYHYDKNGHRYEFHRPVVSMSKGGSNYADGGVAIDSIGWSPPFQDNFPPSIAGTAETESEDPMEPWRAAARSFRDIACEPDSMFECKMDPGDCVIFDNMRVLHGRRQFNISSGKRWLKGTYIQEQVMMSKLAQIPRHLLPRPQERH